MERQPIDDRYAGPIPMTRFELGIQPGQKTPLFSTLGFVIASVVWCMMPFVTLFPLGGRFGRCF